MDNAHALRLINYVGNSLRMFDVKTKADYAFLLRARQTLRKGKSLSPKVAARLRSMLGRG